MRKKEKYTKVMLIIMDLAKGKLWQSFSRVSFEIAAVVSQRKNKKKKNQKQQHRRATRGGGYS
jgi:hypothetical protein